MNLNLKTLLTQLVSEQDNLSPEAQALLKKVNSNQLIHLDAAEMASDDAWSEYQLNNDTKIENINEVKRAVEFGFHCALDAM
ncbi:hypothetical protein KO527_05210 [Pseudoalteromonas sp. C2R02]|uniref:hypothetical protein n=1 Tax=Pseudoalteromonas sp. C2R02 TaxID=2841565 RepID=UPI001C0914ED|nr:hypothetical protein [Pseudoalteromonas sp. C2R02]MBU2968746.1 hypothetical protein [Pseudoalteromonas sp. C2R02]